MSGGLAQSVQVRLITHAQTTGQDPNLVLSRYAIERLLFRLSASPHADRFVLKGAFMLLVWLGESLRPTRDADVLGFGDLGADAIRNTFADICSMDVAPDGLTFDIDSIRVAPIAARRVAFRPPTQILSGCVWVASRCRDLPHSATLTDRDC